MNFRQLASGRCGVSRVVTELWDATVMARKLIFILSENEMRWEGGENAANAKKKKSFSTSSRRPIRNNDCNVSYDLSRRHIRDSRQRERRVPVTGRASRESIQCI